MKKFLVLLLGIFIFIGCKKSPVYDYNPEPEISDSVFNIISVTKRDINVVDISYIINPPTTHKLSSVYINWSTSLDFSANSDSMSVTSIVSYPVFLRIKELKQATKYYARISALDNGKKIYSPIREWETDSIKIISINHSGPPFYVNKGDSSVAIITNIPYTLPDIIRDTKIFLGPYECSVASDEGSIIFINVPSNIPSGKYQMEMRRKGEIIRAPDSVEVLIGKWTKLISPVFPLNPLAAESGLFWFGTTQSPQKGYMLGGNYFNGLGTGAESMNMGFILEFDPNTQAWTKKYPSNPRYFENPICYYYNNSIYVIGGLQFFLDNSGNYRKLMLKKMMRLDLSTLTWNDLNDLPAYGNYDLTSFELGNEWYIGMGSDSANRSICCGRPLPSKKFWKYNPGSNQWNRLSDFPGNHQNFPTCFSIGDKGYAFYGAIPIGDPLIATSFTQELWEYSPSSNAWTKISLPASGGPPEGEKYQVIVNNGKAYFLTAQKYSVGSAYYYFQLQNVCLEWNPVTNVYKKISYKQDAEILRLVYSKNGQYTFQSDALGAFERIPNKTMKLDLND